MGDSRDTLNNRPGTRPEIRMVDDSLVIVMLVRARIADAPVHLVLRIDPDGELFASIGDGRKSQAN